METLIKFSNRQLLLFAAVGTFNTLLSYAIYAAFLSLGFDYKISNLAALLLSIPIGFKMQGRFVFQNSSNRLIFRYFAFWAVLYWLNMELISLLLRHGFNAYQAGALALFPVTGASYLIQKFIVFRRCG